MRRKPAIAELSRMRDYRDRQIAQLVPGVPKANYLAAERAALNLAVTELEARPRQKEIAALLYRYLCQEELTEAEEDELEEKLLDWVDEVQNPSVPVAE